MLSPKWECCRWVSPKCTNNSLPMEYSWPAEWKSLWIWISTYPAWLSVSSCCCIFQEYSSEQQAPPANRQPTWHKFCIRPHWKRTTWWLFVLINFAPQKMYIYKSKHGKNNQHDKKCIYFRDIDIQRKGRRKERKLFCYSIDLAAHCQLPFSKTSLPVLLA